MDVSSTQQGEMVKIIISDTGIGIPEDDIKNIFTRFYIVDKSRSKEKGGTGLGLSIAKYVLDMHRGTIQVKSTRGFNIICHRCFCIYRDIEFIYFIFCFFISSSTR
ncbi:MAG TPA: sensor histidine kinase [Clostridiaceae bacterium]